jgi:Predicted nucleotidyltransferases
MKKKAEIVALLQSMMDDLHTQYHVRKIGIFGSYSKEKQTDMSDIDIVVEFDQPIGMMAFVHLGNLISDRLGLEVDLVTPEGLHPLIREQVLKEVVYV